jgi:hypothetical protein
LLILTIKLFSSTVLRNSAVVILHRISGQILNPAKPPSHDSRYLGQDLLFESVIGPATILLLVLSSAPVEERAECTSNDTPDPGVKPREGA